jgi:hypothetical protein
VFDRGPFHTPSEEAGNKDWDPCKYENMECDYPLCTDFFDRKIPRHRTLRRMCVNIKESGGGFFQHVNNNIKQAFQVFPEGTVWIQFTFRHYGR